MVILSQDSLGLVAVLALSLADLAPDMPYEKAPSTWEPCPSEYPPISVEDSDHHAPSSQGTPSRNSHLEPGFWLE